jgi:hypothetical protein
MSFHEGSADLQRQLARLASEFDLSLLRRYDLRRPFRHEALGMYRRLRIAIGRALRRVGLRRTPPPPPWVPALKHLDGADGAAAMVIWGLGLERDLLRRACTAIEAQRAADPRFVPVLITDVADFAFFSRLGWLVEFVPRLSAPAENYAMGKLRYLAWRYRDSPALPISQCLDADVAISILIAQVREPVSA